MYFIVYNYCWAGDEMVGYIVYGLDNNEYNVRINFVYEFQYEKVA